MVSHPMVGTMLMTTGAQLLAIAFDALSPESRRWLMSGPPRSGWAAWPARSQRRLARLSANDEYRRVYRQLKSSREEPIEELIG